MRKFMMSTIGLVALAAGPAIAADMPVKAVPPPPPPFSWTGAYLGAQVGGGWAHTSYASDFNCAVGIQCEVAAQNSSGWVLGGQGGYRYQFNRVVLGIEGSFAGADINSTTGSTCTPGVNTCIGIPGGFDVHYKTSVDALASGTLQAGWAFDSLFGGNGNLLWYVKGGWASARINRQANDVLGPATAATFVSTFHSYANGYTVGTGAEWAFSPTVSLALEYDYYHLNAGGGATTAASGTGVNAFLNTVGPLSANVQTVMLRMNLRFPQLLSF